MLPENIQRIKEIDEAEKKEKEEAEAYRDNMSKNAEKILYIALSDINSEYKKANKDSSSKLIKSKEYNHFPFNYLNYTLWTDLVKEMELIYKIKPVTEEQRVKNVECIEEFYTTLRKHNELTADLVLVDGELLPFSMEELKEKAEKRHMKCKIFQIDDLQTISFEMKTKTLDIIYANIRSTIPKLFIFNREPNSICGKKRIREKKKMQ